MNHRSLAFRLGAWYTLLLSATFALVGTGTFYGLQQYLHANLRDSLRRRSTQVEQILIAAPADATNSAIAREIEIRIAPEFNNRFVRVRECRQSRCITRSPADRSSTRQCFKTSSSIPARRLRFQQLQSLPTSI